MIQVRNVPPELHTELVRRARLRGVPLTTYIQGILEKEVERPPADEVFDRIEARWDRLSVPAGTAVEMVREDRERMEREWDRLFSMPRRSSPS